MSPRSHKSSRQPGQRILTSSQTQVKGIKMKLSHKQHHQARSLNNGYPLQLNVISMQRSMMFFTSPQKTQTNSHRLVIYKLAETDVKDRIQRCLLKSL
ncbi:hypothetical protein B9Z55_012866 [Caenorhabditis nigoni]|uniref:Uncharacterized protein n=1 Tax=Caenorhabditis nigoni TaxID=1611254 RepID=A0A2G5TZB7_9PELO|nr:hypothetical protein B9Z55_012866 [Caenorhabditis nigoni]